MKRERSVFETTCRRTRGEERQTWEQETEEKKREAKTANMIIMIVIIMIIMIQ